MPERLQHSASPASSDASSGAIDFVLDETGALIAGPTELWALLGAIYVGGLIAKGAAAIQQVGDYVAAVRHVRDPARPWVLVQLTPKAAQAGHSLTPRQLEVAGLVAIGRSNSEIGAALGCSINTVRTHLRAVYEQLGVSNRVELVRALEGA